MRFKDDDLLLGGGLLAVGWWLLHRQPTSAAADSLAAARVVARQGLATAEHPDTTAQQILGLLASKGGTALVALAVKAITRVGTDTFTLGVAHFTDADLLRGAQSIEDLVAATAPPVDIGLPSLPVSPLDLLPVEIGEVPVPEGLLLAPPAPVPEVGPVELPWLDTVAVEPLPPMPELEPWLDAAPEIGGGAMDLPPLEPWLEPLPSEQFLVVPDAAPADLPWPDLPAPSELLPLPDLTGSLPPMPEQIPLEETILPFADDVSPTELPAGGGDAPSGGGGPPRPPVLRAVKEALEVLPTPSEPAPLQWSVGEVLGVTDEQLLEAAQGIEDLVELGALPMEVAKSQTGGIVSALSSGEDAILRALDGLTAPVKAVLQEAFPTLSPGTALGALGVAVGIIMGIATKNPSAVAGSLLAIPSLVAGVAQGLAMGLAFAPLALVPVIFDLLGADHEAAIESRYRRAARAAYGEWGANPVIQGLASALDRYARGDRARLPSIIEALRLTAATANVVMQPKGGDASGLRPVAEAIYATVAATSDADYRELLASFGGGDVSAGWRYLTATPYMAPPGTAAGLEVAFVPGTGEILLAPVDAPPPPLVSVNGGSGGGWRAPEPRLIWDPNFPIPVPAGFVAVSSMSGGGPYGGGHMIASLVPSTWRLGDPLPPGWSLMQTGGGGRTMMTALIGPDGMAYGAWPT